jgi:hypothetical protein
MRTIFASAVVAATAMAEIPDIRDVTQFLGGFFDEWEMENNLDELEVCTTDAEGTIDLAFKVQEELANGQHVQAAKDMAAFTSKIQTTIADCKSMQDDLNRIKAWASIFKDQTELVSTITKNVLKHPTAFAKDAKKAEADWMAGLYHDAGTDFAELLTLGVGKVKSDLEAVMPLLDLLSVPDFLAGFIYGMVGESHLTEIETCYAGVTPLAHYADDFIKDLTHFQIFDAIKQMEEFVYHMQLDLQPCVGGAMSDDLAAIEAWGAQFKDPMSLVESVTKHFLFHKKKIEADWATEKSDWAVGEYFQAGKIFADMAVLTIGPIEEPVPSASNGIVEIPEFLGGFFYGMVGESHLTEIEACYNSAEPLADYVENIITDLESGNILGAIKNFKAFQNNMQTDLLPCRDGAMADDIAGLEAWGAQFKDPVALLPSTAEHYFLHKGKIETDIATEKADWSAGEYFKSGEQIADIATILFGKVQDPATFLQ